jgi:hypothetical protein
VALAPTKQNEDYQSGNLIIKDDAIQRPSTTHIQESSSAIHVGNVQSGRHSTRSEKAINPEVLSLYLSNKHSPLSDYATQISQSPYWSTILGICTIEQYGCTKAPFNNYWGLKSHGSLIRYGTLEEGIGAIDSFLTKAEANGRTTIESFRGWYCASECVNWESTVINTKTQIESLIN